MTGILTDQERATLKQQHLRDPLVQHGFANYLHAWLEENHDVDVPRQQLLRAIAIWLDAIEHRLELAEAFYAAGYRSCRGN